MRRSPLRARPPVDHRDEPGYREFKTPAWGPCAACGTRGLLLRHHVVLEQHVRREGGDPWGLDNSILIGAGLQCVCHREHHSAVRRLPLSIVPT